MANTLDRQSTELPSDGNRPLTLTLGHEQLVIQKRYEVLSILNDFMMGIWFVVGSACFMDDRLKTLGLWLFLIGSVQMLIRPIIRLSRRIHLRHIPQSHWDF